MSIVENQYSTKENKQIKDYHRQRRMFVIYQGKLYIARKGVGYSHAEWFVKNDWMTVRNDKLINEVIRGIIDPHGNVNFYIGHNFQINNKIAQNFFPYIKVLDKRLKLSPMAKVLGGAIKQVPGKIWPARKEYGRIKDYINY